MQTDTASQKVFKPNVNAQRPSNGRREVRTSGAPNKNMRLYSNGVDVRVVSHLNEIVMNQVKKSNIDFFLLNIFQHYPVWVNHMLDSNNAIYRKFCMLYPQTREK